jgi:hypothetical protein
VYLTGVRTPPESGYEAMGSNVKDGSLSVTPVVRLGATPDGQVRHGHYRKDGTSRRSRAIEVADGAAPKSPWFDPATRL